MASPSSVGRTISSHRSMSSPAAAARNPSGVCSSAGSAAHAVGEVAPCVADHDQRPARSEPGRGTPEHVLRQVQVRDQDEVVCRVAGGLPRPGVRDDPVDVQPAGAGLLLALGQPYGREVDGRHPPVLLGQPDRMPSLAGTEVDRASRRPGADDPLHLGVRSCAPHVVVLGVPLVPPGPALIRHRIGVLVLVVAPRALVAGLPGVLTRHPPSIADMGRPATGPDLVVREAAPADIEAMAAIYDEQVRTSVATFDTEPRGSAYLSEKLASHAPGDVVLVACAGDALLGYAFSGSFRPRPAEIPRRLSGAQQQARHGGGAGGNGGETNG